MQSVNAAFTAEEKDLVRQIAQNLQVSWHKESSLGNRMFTIGVSTIGGNDVIGINAGAIGSPSNYRYFNESAYVLGLTWERGFNVPEGGLTKALAEARLDNTSQRFLPNYMGGRSELYTAILPRKPLIINAGFKIGVDQTIPQFAGLINKQPSVDQETREVTIEAGDYSEFFQNKNAGQGAMFTGLQTDVVIKNLLAQQGMSTAQYRIDSGLNTIPFGMYDADSKLADVINQLVQAENGQFYQDESGIFRFENRQHWDNAPYTQVQKIIMTGQVISAKSPSDDHIINVVEVSINPRVKASGATLYTLSGQITLAPGATEQFVDFENPVLAASAPVFVANSSADGSGSNKTSSVYIKNTSLFTQAAKYTFVNTSSSLVYITSLSITGRWAVLQYPTAQTIRVKDDSSVTAYQEQVLTINNPYIQDSIWAESLGQTILNDFSSPENLQEITIRAIPELQLGDLISWQGKYWRIYDIKSTLSKDVGYVQELKLLKRNSALTYFRIGISTIGGNDAIAP